MNYFIEAITKKYATFTGRARRKEYWMFMLFFSIGSMICQMVDTMIGLLLGLLFSGEDGNSMGFLMIRPITSIYNLALLVPLIAICVRRMHDLGKSGWWYLVNLIPCVGWIVFLVWTCLDSQPGSNQYGDNPKGVA